MVTKQQANHPIDPMLTEETLGYVTSEDPVNTDKRYLIAGSQNVLIDYNRKVGIRSGYTRLGAGSSSMNPVRNAFTWNTSTGTELPLRFYNDQWEVYLGTVDGTVINAWKKLAGSMSTTAIPRGALFYDSTEGLDEMIFAQGDTSLYEWNGAVAIAASVTSNTITKAGSNTFGVNRFYSASKESLVNVRTGTIYTYSGGVGTTTLTGVSPDPTSDIVAGDILIQKLVTHSSQPSRASGGNNHTIFSFENQLFIGSQDDDQVYVSKNSSVTDYTYSTPRVSGEGGLLTLDGPMIGGGIIGKYAIIFAGKNSIFNAAYTQITVSTTLAETIAVQKLDTGPLQGAYNAETIVPINNAIMYLTNEPTLRLINNPNNLMKGIDPTTYSNPIKPDFDAETFTNACAIWYKNAYVLAANSHLYMLQFKQDADGAVRRYWQAPQVLPVRALSIVGGALVGHSNTVPESYTLFSGTSDIVANGTTGNPNDKVPVNSIANFAYQNYGKREQLKTCDEYYVEGEISENTNDLLMSLLYDYGGATQITQRTIDGSDDGLLEGSIGLNSLAQQSLGQQPLGGLLNPPSNARRFRVNFELPRDDFHEMAVSFSTNDIDRYWAITAHGANTTLSPRRDTTIMR